MTTPSMSRADLVQKLKAEEQRMYRLYSTFKDAGPEAGIFESAGQYFARVRDQINHPPVAAKKTEG